MSHRTGLYSGQNKAVQLFKETHSETDNQINLSKGQSILSLPTKQTKDNKSLYVKNNRETNKKHDKINFHTKNSNSKDHSLPQSNEKENLHERQSNNLSFVKNTFNKQRLGESTDYIKKINFEKPDHSSEADKILSDVDSEEEKDIILSDLADPDRDTLGSSSSELAALKSPSRESRNSDYESSPQPTLPDEFPESGDTDTPTFTSPPAVLTRSGRGTPHPRGAKSSAKTSVGSHIIEKLSDTNQSDAYESETLLDANTNAGNSPFKSLSPAQNPLPESLIVKKTPTPIETATPRDNFKPNSKPPASFENHSPPKPGSSLTTPYSSHRLKPQGDAAKRSTASSLNRRPDVSGGFEADSLDFVKDSLENASVDVEADDDNVVDKSQGQGLIADSLEDSETEKLFSQAAKTIERDSDSPDNLLSREISLVPVNEHEKQLPLPDARKLSVTKEDSSLSIKQTDKFFPSVTPDKPIFILKSDPRKSRSSSTHTTGRLSHQSQAKLNPQPTAKTASSVHHSMRGPSTSNRVYVTSPTFSDDDETQYRLVSSRLDGDEEEDTYRELDMAAIQGQARHGTGSAKLSGGKHVTYSDSKLPVAKTQENKEPGYMSNPYGLKMAPEANEAIEITSKKQSSGQNVAADLGNPGINQQGRIINHNPQLTEQALPPSHLKEPVQRPSRVRGISLPTGPTYDPRDEEDLQRETSYQQGLQMKIQDWNRKVEEVTIPTLPLNSGSQDFVMDSLDYASVEDPARAFVEIFKADPNDYYDRQPPNVGFRNPPPLPQEFVDNKQQPATDRLKNINLENDDDVDYEDMHHHRVNPQVQPRFYKPQTDPTHGYDTMSSRYVEVGDNTERSQPSSSLTNGHSIHAGQNNYLINGQKNLKMDHKLNVQESIDYTDRSNYSKSEHDINKARPKVTEAPMEAVQPTPPKYDYINNNKEDYGKPHPKSYSLIHEVTKEEKEKLNEIFIQPKVKEKPKKGILKKKRLDNGQGGSQVTDPGQFEDEQQEDERELSPAEQVWAQRSSTLAKRFDGKGRQGKITGALQKYNSESSLNQTRRPSQQKPYPADRKAFLTEMPTPPSQESSYNNQVSLPYSPRQNDIQVLPVSSQIILDDGQRISVDVNLKLIPTQPMSPQYQQYPPHGQNLHQYPQQYTQQQPQYLPHAQNVHSQQQHPHHSYHHHPDVDYGRQYPAAPQYVDDSISSHDMQALEYNPTSPQGYRENYRYVSPRERYSADEALRQLNSSRTDINPYGKIPPIQRSADGQHPSSAPEQAGSYTDMFRKQKEKNNEKPWYRVYGLKDYRKMQKEVRLGTLGPDLDSDVLKERREKFQRQSDYAKQVMEKNKQDLVHKKPPAFPRPKEENDIMNRRKLAVEYAKSVPKPIIKPQPTEYNNYELASERSPIAKHHRKPGDMVTPSPRLPQKQKEPDLLDIDKLRQRYEEDKQNEALIRRNRSNSLPKGEKFY